MSFIEQRLLDEVGFGFNGGPTWSTGQVVLRSGIIRRNVRRSRPISKFRGSYNNRDAIKAAELLAAFNATNGAAYGFRFRNHIDYKATAESLGIALGGAQAVQLTKAYTFGSKTTSVSIRKPNTDVVIYADGAPVSASIDTTTGIVTFTATVGQVMTWTGTFDVPVMFENDDFMATITTRNTTTIEISLIEDLAA